MEQRIDKRKLIAGVAAAIALTAAVFFFAFFYVPNENVEVLGNTRYQDSEIRRMAMPGFVDHNALILRLFRKNIVMEDVPFVDSIEVEYIAHDQVRLHVNEDFPVGYLLQDGYRFYFDSVGLVIESTDESGEAFAEKTAEEEETEASNKPEFRPALTDVAPVSGLTEERVTLGEYMPVVDDSIFQTLLVLNKLISKFEILPDEIIIGEGNTMTLRYKKARIALGDDNLLEEKMTRAAAILPQLKNMDGTLHLEHYAMDTINIIFEKTQKPEEVKPEESEEVNSEESEEVEPEELEEAEPEEVEPEEPEEGNAEP